MRRAVILSVLDQGLLSAVSLLVSLALIRFGDPEAVGRYALALAVYFLAFSVHYSLAALPISVRIYGRTDDAEPQILKDICTAALLIILGGGVAAAAVLSLFDVPAETVFAGSAMVTFGLLRELARSVFLARGHMTRLIGMNLLASALTVSAIILFWQTLPPETACLSGMAVGTGIAALVAGPRIPITPASMARSLRNYAVYFRQTRWSLAGGLAYECQNRVYVFAVDIMRGATANGLLQAGRLLVSPVDLVVMAWGRVAVPRLAAMVREGREAAAYTATRINAVCLGALSCAWCIALYASWSFIEPLIFAGKYDGVAPIVAAWCLVLLVAAPLRAVEWLFYACDQFRHVALARAASALMVLSFSALLALPVPLTTIVFVLAAGQCIALAGLVWLLANPSFKRQEATP